MPVDLNQGPIDPTEPEFQTMLANLQGNILKGHGRDFVVYHFIKFDAMTDEVREHLQSIASRFVTSALKQIRDTEEYHRYKIPGGLFGSFLLSASGYRALGFTDAQLNDLFEEPQGPVPLQSSFKAGMAAHGDELNDPEQADWEPGYQQEIDALILLADDDERFLLRVSRDLIDELEEFTTVLHVERGIALRNETNEGIEHFGYADGRSQPVFLTPDLADEGKSDKWQPGEPLKLALVEDQAAGEEDCFGSYYVFRKMEQDVLGFSVREQTLADELKLAGPDRERAGAMAVGRFRDGTPLVLSQTDGFVPPKENNFDYTVDDAQGLKCPFHAHIRKANPRGEGPGGPGPDGDRSHRIARRGITYGQRNHHPNAFQALDDLPREGVGLLFACFQASIPNQFAFMQNVWVDNENFVSGGIGEDPIIGQRPRSGADPVPQKWRKQWGDDAAGEVPVETHFGNFVKLKGGEFFYAPSIPFLQKLAP